MPHAPGYAEFDPQFSYPFNSYYRVQSWLLRHGAPYNLRLGQMEMHLVSGCYQEASVAGEGFEFIPGETILTECWYKYTLDEFEELATQAGYHPQLVWTNRDELFSVQYFVAE